MRSETITFVGGAGQRLTAELELPAGRARACALFAHCFHCSRHSHATARIGRALTEQGMAVVRYDFTGADASEVDGLVAAANLLRARGLGPRILVGHSLGGAAVLVAAARIPEAVAVATINAPSDPLHVRGLLAGDATRLAGEGTAELHLGERTFRVRNRLFAELGEERLLEAVRELRRPLLVFHSPFDDTVPVDDARKIFMAARHPRSFVSLDQADHFITDPGDAAYIAHVLAAWASRYLESAAAPAPDIPGQEQEAIDRVVVHGRGPGLAHTIRAGRHELRADEPARLGGTDTGPTPYDLLLAALGSCTAMTLRLYADARGWPLEGVRVELRHEKIHAEHCASCETQAGKLDRIERTVHLEGPLDDDQRRRLLEIADRCPVHRTLESEVLIETGDSG